MKYTGRVLVKPDGEVAHHDQERWRTFHSMAPGTYVVRFEKPHRPRSLESNAFFHGPLLNAVMAATGDWDADRVKAGLKRKYRIQSTAALSQKQMGDLCEQVIADGLCGEFGDGFELEDG